MNMNLSKGCLVVKIKDNSFNQFIGLVPEDYKINQQKRDNNYHITIINSQEMPKTELKEIKNDLPFDYLILGLGKTILDDNEVYYLVIYSNFYNKVRKEYGLKKKDYFHITLGFKHSDIHTKDKGINNIFKKNNDLDLTLAHYINDINTLQFIQTNYNYTDPKLLILQLKINPKNQLIIDQLIEKNNYIGHIFNYQITQNIKDLQLAIKNYQYDVNLKYDKKNNVTAKLIKVFNQKTMETYNYRTELALYYQNNIILHEMPRNFSWIEENKIGGISAIRNEKDLLVLKTLGINKIYYFLEKHYFDEIKTSDFEINYIYCINTKAPSFEDMLNVLTKETFDQPVLFGCLGGYGRTGTALACYLCYHNKMSSEQSINYLRKIRPKSIESDDQINFVRQFSSNLFKLDSTVPKIKTPIKFIMLVGLPGAGKTTFCDLFLTCSLNVKIVTQDTMGRNMCESSLLKFIKESDVVILDRTNTTKADRIKWLKLTMLSPKQCLCIHLTTPKFICINRAKNRENHPTIKKGGGERIINDMEKKFEAPSKDEGYSSIVYLEDEEDVRNYLKKWNCTKISIEEKDNNFIHKFPRTAHLFNIGGATVDDRFVSLEENKYFFNNVVQITEKVDGAQLGISMDENYQILVQNRSHYVNSSSHSQFKILDKWIADHRDDLYNILDVNTILFGEWLYAKHSISYNKLPDYFMAFDLYNKKEKVFYNRQILDEKLENTNIKSVRIMYNGKIENKNQLLKLIENQSDYTDSRVEGIYIKTFEDKYVKYRCKLVRNDFICGNDHWSKGIIEKNQIIF
mgnify:CR=1 FL=1